MGSQGILLTAKTLNQIRPVEIRLQTDRIPSGDEIASFFDAGVTATNIGRLRVETGSDQNTIRVWLAPKASISATDYLAWSDQGVPDFALVREALKRPYARMDGDYSDPSGSPIPNFIPVRLMAQTLAQRAMCDLLLGQPNKALPELTLMHDMCRLLEAAPTHKPMTLVAAMINVAVAGGVYTSVVADGMQSHGWQEPQLVALQKQLHEVNLHPYVLEAIRLEQTIGGELVKAANSPKNFQVWFNLKATNLWQKLKDPMFQFMYFAPRGWYYQNMIVGARLEQKVIDGFDPEKNLISPQKFAGVASEIATAGNHPVPYNYLAIQGMPNYSRAAQTLAHNQTMVNEAQIACALERYHLAHGEYPETLDALVPQFIEKLPHDLINGEPLKYQRKPDGKFLLYSIGWNEKDDGGVDSSKFKSDQYPFADGDWVWQ
jgi:hypothetical protein